MLVGDLDAGEMGLGEAVIFLRTLQALDLSLGGRISAIGSMVHNGAPQEITYLRKVTQKILPNPAKAGDVHYQLGGSEWGYGEDLAFVAKARRIDRLVYVASALKEASRLMNFQNLNGKRGGKGFA